MQCAGRPVRHRGVENPYLAFKFKGGAKGQVTRSGELDQDNKGDKRVPTKVTIS